uniref:uncharacterized protein LOC122596871 n=1 Tax=Erigeron canadensis TaxID=72917 RepID=UPI001CB9A061|nr:uncharacterized protein LOC122596871 [Erigeron canadensis]
MTLPQFVWYYPHERNQESLHIYSTHGFGYDPVSDDYKVISLTYFDYDYKVITTTRLAIYSIRRNTWRQTIIDSSPLTVVGRLLLLVDECFSEVPSPNLCNNATITSRFDSRLVVIRGKLAIYKHFEVWLMNWYGVKESWTKVPLGKLRNELSLGNSVIFDDNGKIRVANRGQTMLIYDFEKGTFSKDVYFWSWQFQLVGSYVESLVSLSRKDTTGCKKIP